MINRVSWIMLVLLASLLIAPLSIAQSVFAGPDGKFEEQTLSVPYTFYNEAFGAAAAYAYGKIGYPQKQSAILATAMVGSKGSIMGFFIGRDLRLPWSQRLFLDPIVQIGWFKDADSYTDGNPDFPDERAGSNDSDEDNFIEGDGWDNIFPWDPQKPSGSGSSPSTSGPPIRPPGRWKASSTGRR